MNIKTLAHTGLCYLFKKDEVIYFDSFGVEYLPKEIKKFINDKNIKTSIFRIMCGYFCILFIEFMFKGKSLNDFTNLFSPNDWNNLQILSIKSNSKKIINCTKKDCIR